MQSCEQFILVTHSHFLLEVLQNLRIYSCISFFFFSFNFGAEMVSPKHVKASRRKVLEGAQIP